MRIGHLTNQKSCEYAMQETFKIWLSTKGLKVVDELCISEVGRIPDFLVLKPGKGLINIEAKCNDMATMLEQLTDNAAYCDYSFALILDICLTPEWFKKKISESKFGLIVYNYATQTITEVFEAHQNKGINRQLQKIVIGKMEKELIKRKQKNYIDTQKDIEFSEPNN
jgi:hypothetical protein